MANNRQLKAQNLDAHIRVLRQDLKTQEAALESVVIRRKEEEESLKTINLDIVNAHRELQNVRNEIYQQLRLVQNKQEALDKETQQFNTDKLSFFAKQEEFDDYVKSEELKLDKRLSELNSLIKAKQEQREAINLEIDTTLAKFAEQSKQLEKECEDKQMELNVVTSDINDAVDTLSQAQNALVSVLKQIDDAGIAFEELKSSEETYAKNLEEKKQYVERKEADLAVWERRLKKWAKEHYPNVEIVL
jgi:chromosome segregation ATPase